MPTATHSVNDLPNYFSRSPGTNRSTYENLKRKLIKRSSEADLQGCMLLLEHAGGCVAGQCQEGETCGRAKQVLLHYRSCATRRDCTICQQLIVLCELHALDCQNQELGCNVLLCPNNKKPLLSSGTPLSGEKCKEMYQKFMSALRLPSREERMKNVNRLFLEDPQVAKTVVWELRRMKRANQLMRATPRGRVIRPVLRGQIMRSSVTGQAAVVPDIVNNLVPIAAWKANIAFVPN